MATQTIRSLRIMALKMKMKLSEREAGLERVNAMAAQYRNLLTKEHERKEESPYTVEMIRFSQIRVRSLLNKCKNLQEGLDSTLCKIKKIVERREREIKAEQNQEKTGAEEDKEDEQGQES